MSELSSILLTRWLAFFVVNAVVQGAVVDRLGHANQLAENDL